ncbi:VCBS repeat-containing protein [Streptomyces varsoviensis]|uniref:FG-GAP repeat domain-containing protein n=1 Tax=Streptomyces varsoviensis TaxID=67373 RepID=UPI00340E342F
MTLSSSSPGATASPNSSGRTRRRTLSRVATAALVAALVGTTAGTAMAKDAAPAPLKDTVRKAAEHRPASHGALKSLKAAAPGSAPIFPVSAVNNSGELYFYWPDGRGGLDARDYVTDGWGDFNAASTIDNDKDDFADALYARTNSGSLIYSTATDSREIPGDWNKYDLVFSPGNLGGAKESDLLARDRDGVLWLFLAYPDGTFTGVAHRVGPGWGQYTAIAGQGDLTGDGKTDIVARDRDGVLWLYKGTGDYNKPFADRTKIGPGWNQFNALFSTGDVDFDGRSDLIARDKSGALWLYKGTGSASAPYKTRVKIGNSGWNQFKLLF